MAGLQYCMQKRTRTSQQYTLPVGRTATMWVLSVNTWMDERMDCIC